MVLGALAWAPDVFWAATPHEIWAALDGRREANAPAGPPAVTAGDVAAWRAILDDAAAEEAADPSPGPSPTRGEGVESAHGDS